MMCLERKCSSRRDQIKGMKSKIRLKRDLKVTSLPIKEGQQTW
jgi:hypothetical protein